MKQKTTDYEIFKKHDSNRPVMEKLVVSLMKSIESHNMLELRPITIDQRMSVIDGQHRLEAAKRLGVPIYYEMDDKIQVKDMVILNANQAAWSGDDYLNFYEKEGFPEYQKLKRFMKEKNLELRVAFMLCGSAGGGVYKDFKFGKYIFPQGNDWIEVQDSLTKIESIIEFLKRKTGTPCTFTQTQAFWKSLITFFNARYFEYDTFMKKLSVRLDLVRSCTKVITYVNLWKEIYNYNNRNPIELDFSGKSHNNVSL